MSGALGQLCNLWLWGTADYVADAHEVVSRRRRRACEHPAVRDSSPRCRSLRNGLIEEGSEATEEDYEGSVMDAALIGAAQRVEHYEIAG